MLVVVDAQLAGDYQTYQTACTALAARLDISDSSNILTSFVAAGTNLTFPSRDPSCGSPFQVVSSDMCTVTLDVATSDRSSTGMEVWLPFNWTGRFLSTGNGGLSGCIQYPDMDYTTSLGFATTGSNNGHSGTGGAAFLNNIEVVKDFAWRSLLTSAQVGKNVTREFFGRPHHKSYYNGCSTGGRQGWKMAQDFPEVFDGIVAGAPAIDWNMLVSWSGMFYPIFANAGPDGVPPLLLWPVIDAEILKQCDGIDGAIDGIIEEPSLCHFQADALLCSATKRSSCLTPKQVETVRAIFSPLVGENGTILFPALQYSPQFILAIAILYSQGQLSLEDDWYKYAVFNDPTFNATFLSPQDIAFASNLNPGDVNTFSGDLSAFKARGAKILHYHGQMDFGIPSANSNRYYELVAHTMGLPPSSLDEFYRLFRVSGMEHCGGGPGAIFIGLTGNNDPTLAVDYKRAHCRYPYRNVFGGKGNVKDPASWNCIL
ncbi:carboxylic ester hydrolase [Favolaschia claudopus]|uniref:Carboxylic ester hydrolase n=1 Tax=Favolaschia claudopus TaxID=2862362 RepID=A0AAW0EHP9_9AGAR